ncbi:MAG TPA: hypothetical protein VMF91_20535 [Bryobacteraceae bacterium]|nr:hypothetical protein [Bryobacteraceae bacterium]
MFARSETRRDDITESKSIQELVSRFESLHDGPAYVGQVIARGSGAIPFLSEVLLNGRPSSIPQPRQWAVEALAGLGAYEILLTYLRQPLITASPVVRHGEQAVQNTAARELSNYETEQTFAILLDCLKRSPLPGVIESIALYRRIAVAPYLIDCLEDDTCRSAALEGLELLGDAVRILLIESALKRVPGPPDWESPSSVRRRQCCLQLLRSSQLENSEVQRLTSLLSNDDPDIVISVARLLIESSAFRNRSFVRNHLKRVQRKAGWWLQDELRSLLSRTESGF